MPLIPFIIMELKAFVFTYNFPDLNMEINNSIPVRPALIYPNIPIADMPCIFKPILAVMTREELIKRPVTIMATINLLTILFILLKVSSKFLSSKYNFKRPCKLESNTFKSLFGSWIVDLNAEYKRATNSLKSKLFILSTMILSLK